MAISLTALRDRAPVLRGWVITSGRAVTPQIAYAVKRFGAVAAILASAARSSVRKVTQAHQLWLTLVEISGVVIGTFGIAQWSWPAAVIIGGLVLVAVAEVRPHRAPQMPRISLPDPLLRQQAELAAKAINVARFGIADVDPADLSRLSSDACERLIAVAKSLGKS